MKFYEGDQAMTFLKATSAAVVLTIAISTPTFANYYRLLEKDFNAAADNISLSDFREYGHAKSKLCVEYRKEQPMEETNVRIGIYTRVTDGPGPGLPPIETAKLLLTTYDYHDLSTLFDSTTLESKAKELKVTQGNPEASVTLLRKQKDFIYFKRTLSWDETTHDEATDKDVVTNKTADLYGYCYDRP
jgi:hypothetical protein